MRKILYTDFSSGFGGSSTVLFDFLKNLDRNKFDPVVVVARDGQNFDKIRTLNVKVIKINIKVIGLPVPVSGGSYGSLLSDLVLHLLPNALILSGIIRKEKVNMVHINNNILHCIDVILAATFTKVPCVCHIRETRVPGRLERFFGKFIDVIIVLNKNVFQNVAAIFGSEKTRLICDGLDLSDAAIQNADAPRIRNEFNLHGAFCVGIVGRLVKGKGLDDFIQSASIVAKLKKNVKFLIVGDDPDKEKNYQDHLKVMVGQLGLANDVIFTGWRSDKFDIINALDVLIQASSVAEGFGLTCIEAMALAKPVVATDIPGPSDIVETGKTGYLVPPENPEAMAAAVINFINSPDLAKQFGKAGRLNAEAKFDIKKNVQEIEKIYEGLLN